MRIYKYFIIIIIIIIVVVVVVVALVASIVADVTADFINVVVVVVAAAASSNIVVVVSCIFCMLNFSAESCRFKIESRSERIHLPSHFLTLGHSSLHFNLICAQTS